MRFETEKKVVYGEYHKNYFIDFIYHKWVQRHDISMRQCQGNIGFKINNIWQKDDTHKANDCLVILALWTA